MIVQLVATSAEKAAAAAEAEEEPMGFQPSDIPHHETDPAVGAFLRHAFRPERIEDLHERRLSTRKQDLPFSRHLREAFAYLLRERPCDVVDWSRLTGSAFTDEAHLYDCLQGLHDYFFGDRPAPPVPPDPDGPRPDWVDLLWNP
ncbi:hypothetical protein ACFY00_06585 [Kitasatospora sp. NPDC001540]|uniref:hypothetical protein n=1 Tax=Kitasatospora sp. NPDC001540 TaxID=3364014 RepID=UPI003674D00C